MNCKPDEIMRLLNELAQKTECVLSPYGFAEMQNKMEEQGVVLGKDNLYRKLYLKARKTDSRKLLPLNATNIESIVKFLGYTNYQQFQRREHPTQNPVLQSCVGSWYSYVRDNSGSRNVFVSPVKIYSVGKELRMELKGPSRTFDGVIKLSGNCFYCFLESKKEKNLHLVFKVGFAENPEVLQGVFSGISSGGDPISGREILVRQKDDEKLENQKLSIDALLNSEKEQEQLLGKYFDEKSGNILSAGKASAFTWDDLRTK